MIHVRLFASLAAGSTGAGGEFQVEARPGLTVADVIRMAGLDGHDLYVVLINGRGASPGSVLKDGDRVGFFPPMSGG